MQLFSKTCFQALNALDLLEGFETSLVFSKLPALTPWMP